jgi:triphosphatase
LAAYDLELAVFPERIEQLRQLIESEGYGAEALVSAQSCTFYDSADHKLRRHGLSLCLRETGGRHAQIVESYDSASGSFLSLSQWEDAITGDRPDFAAPETGPRLRDVVFADELRPLFTTALSQTRITLAPTAETRVELTINEGEIRSAEGDSSEPICEIGLTLMAGDPGAVYDLALRLLEHAPLRIETRSAAERGYRLLAADRGSAPVTQAGPIALRDSMTVESALQGIGRNCITHLLRNGPAAMVGQAEGVHQMRVAARRLRAALSAVKPMIPAKHYGRIVGELKWLAGVLGPARNWDVFAMDLLEPVGRALSAERDLKRLTEVTELRRRAAYESVKEVIESERYTATMLRLGRWFETCGWRDQPASERAALLFATISDVAPGLMERRWRQTRKRSRQFGKLSPGERHKLRIALKKLRYTMEFLEDLFDKSEVKAMAKRLKPLQEDLGHMNDLMTAHDLVEEIARHVNESGREISRAGGMVLGWHDRGLADSEPSIRKDVRRLRRVKPFWPRVQLPFDGEARPVPGPAEVNAGSKADGAIGSNASVDS